ncbi:MAG TPA: VWA domain-containing protein [Candidatus Angelobacter sp.]
MFPNTLRLSVFFSTLLVYSAAAQEPSQPHQPGRFRTQSNAVLIPTLVRDKGGALVHGLKAEDFIVEDNGVEQRVHLDGEDEPAPVSLVIAIQLGRTAASELPRIETLGTMLDPVLGSGRNRAAIVTFDSEVELIRSFTSNGRLIAADLKNLRPGDGKAAVVDAVGFSVALLKREPRERRRVLLLVSETRDHGSHVVSFEDTVQAISESNTLVYALAFSPSVSKVLDTIRGQHDDKDVPSQRGALQLMPLVVMAVQAMRKNAPKTIASMSGGEYELFTSQSGFESRMTAFANHLHNRYLLSFEPKEPQLGLHKVSVRLRQPQNATVLARDRYWATAAESDHEGRVDKRQP